MENTSQAQQKFDALVNQHNIMYNNHKTRPITALEGPQSSRKLKFPDFVTTAQGCDRLTALRNGSL